MTWAFGRAPWQALIGGAVGCWALAAVALIVSSSLLPAVAGALLFAAGAGLMVLGVWRVLESRGYEAQRLASVVCLVAVLIATGSLLLGSWSVRQTSDQGRRTDRLARQVAETQNELIAASVEGRSVRDATTCNDALVLIDLLGTVGASNGQTLRTLGAALSASSDPAVVATARLLLGQAGHPNPNVTAAVKGLTDTRRILRCSKGLVPVRPLPPIPSAVNPSSPGS